MWKNMSLDEKTNAVKSGLDAKKSDQQLAVELNTTRQTIFNFRKGKTFGKEPLTVSNRVYHNKFETAMGSLRDLSPDKAWSIVLQEMYRVFTENEQLRAENQILKAENASLKAGDVKHRDMIDKLIVVRQKVAENMSTDHNKLKCLVLAS